MSIKDKIIFGLMVLLIVGGGYIQYSYTEIVATMEVITQEQLKHVEEVNKEFREDLRKLNLQFIGRGKHVKQAQLDITANTNLINSVSDSLSSLIGDVRYELNEFSRDVTKRFSNVESDISDMDDAIASARRRAAKEFSRLEQKIDNVDNRVTEVDNLPIIQKAREKKD